MAYEQRLDMLVRVSSENVGVLKKVIAQQKAMLQAEAALQRQRQKSGQEMAAYVRLEKQITKATMEEGRKKLELKKNEKDLTAARQRQKAAVVALRVEQARSAIEANDLVLAQKKLMSAIRQTRAGSAAQVRLERQLRQVRERHTEAVRRQRREMSLLHRTAKAGKAILGGLATAWNMMTRVLASFVLIGFTARTVFRTMFRYVIGPLKEITKNVLEATDAFRQLDASFIGIVGSMRAVRSLTRDITGAIGNLPTTSLEARRGVRGLAFTAGTAGMIQTEGVQRLSQIHDLLRILVGLATIDPEQGIMGARFSVREALAGEFRSLRFRFELSPTVIAAGIGKSLEDLKADPQLTLKALKKFVETFIGDEAFEQFSRLLSTQGKRFKGAMQEFYNLIGDQGIYDKITAFLKQAATALSMASREGPTGARPALQGAAALISRSLEFMFDELLKVGSQTIRALTGINVDLRKLDADQLDQLGRSLAVIVNFLALLALAMARNAPSIAGLLSKFVDIGPLTIPEVELDIKRSQRRLEQGRYFHFGGPGEGTYIPLSEEERALEQSSLQFNLDKLEILRDQERLISGEAVVLEEQTDILKEISDRAMERIKPLRTFSTQLEQMFDIFGGYKVPTADQTGMFMARINMLFDASKPESLVNILGNLDAEVAKMQQERLDVFADPDFPEARGILISRAAKDLFDQLRKLDEKIAEQLGARAITIAGAEAKISSTMRAMIQNLISSIQNLPQAARQRGMSDLLRFLGEEATGLPGMPGGGAWPEEKGVLYERLKAPLDLARGQGLDVDIVSPELLREISLALADIDTSLIETTEDMERAAEVVLGLAAGFQEWALTMIVNHPEQAAVFTDLLGYIDDLVRKTEEAREEFREESITKALADGIKRDADTIKKEVDRIADAMDELEDELEKRQAALYAGFDLIPKAKRAPLVSQMFAGFEQTFGDMMDVNDPNSPAGQARLMQKQIDEQLALIRTTNAMMREINGLTEEQADIAKEQNEKNLDVIKAAEEEIQDLHDIREAIYERAGVSIGEAMGGLMGGVAAGVAGLAPQEQIARLDEMLRLLKNISQIRAEMKAAGLDETVPILKPEDVQGAILMLDAYGKALVDMGLTTEEVRDKLSMVVDDFILIFQRIGEEGPPEIAAAVEESIARLEEFRDAAIIVAKDITAAYEQAAENIATTFEESLVDALVDAVWEGAQSIEDILRNLVISIQREITRLVIQMTITRYLTNFLTSMLNPAQATEYPQGPSGFAPPPVETRFGNLFQDSRIVPHQLGGLVTQPGVFPMANSRVGSIAEDDDEWVLPVAMTAAGKLGVHAEGGGGGRPVVVNITVNTPNADSFRKGRREIVSEIQSELRRN